MTSLPFYPLPSVYTFENYITSHVVVYNITGAFFPFNTKSKWGGDYFLPFVRTGQKIFFSSSFTEKFIESEKSREKREENLWQNKRDNIFHIETKEKLRKGKK